MSYDVDLAIIGGGSAGLLAAEIAPKMGVKAVLIERSRLGGDCLWTGCVPSKALLASAKAADVIRHADRYGLPATDIDIDTAAVWQRLRALRDAIAESDDNPEKYRGLGVDVVFGDASFVDEHTIAVGERRLTARFILVCTGSRPAAPPIPGLEEIGYLTSETVFELERAPASLVIVGAGPIGVEIAQAMARLGVTTTCALEQAPEILGREEPLMFEDLCRVLEHDGVDLYMNVELERAELGEGGKVLSGKVGGEARRWAAEEVFIAAGRKANIESLQLEQAGVETGPRGIAIDSKMRTNVKSVYAAGDCAGRFLFTHSAGSEAATALRNMFYPGSSSATDVIPWATFTDPELAHVGLTSAEAREQLGADRVRVFEHSFADSDRARTDSATVGKAVVITDSSYRILGAHILAPAASEMIGQFTMAIGRGARLTPEFRDLVQVYPTFSSAFARLASEAAFEQLESPLFRALRRVNNAFG